MATDSNYIGVAMGLDVTDLKAGLAEANKQIQLANSEFKAASSGMEDWTKSTEGLTAKVKQLDSVLTAQKSKLAGLQAEYDKVAKEQGESSEAARKLQVQINNQTAVVNSTQREFDNYSQTLKEAKDGTIDLAEVSLKGGKAVKEMGDSADEAGGKLEGLKTVGKAVGVGLAAIGGAAVAAVGSFLSLAESTRETRENMAKLETAFESANHSAEAAQGTYKELYGILGDEGAATEAAQQLAKFAQTEDDLAANTRILTGVMAEYGSSIPTEGLAEGMAATAAMGEVQGVLADALEWQGVNLDEYNDQLATMATEEERAAYIQQTLTDLYGESADAYAEKNKSIIEAREAEAALAQATAELGAIAEPIMTTLKLLAVDLLGAITPFVELIGTGLQGALNGTAGASQTLADGLSGILEVILQKAMEVLPTLLDMIVQLIPSIATTLIDAIPTLLDTVMQIVEQIISTLSTVLPQIIAEVVALVPNLIYELLFHVPALLEAATTLFMAIVDALPEIINKLMNQMVDVLDAVVFALIDGIPLLLNAALQFLNSIVEAVPTIITELVRVLPGIINAIIWGLEEAIPLLLNASITLLNAIIEAIPIIIQTLTKALPKIIDCILSGVLDALPLLLDAAIELFFAIIDAIPVIVKELYAAFPDIIEAILKSVLNAVPKLFSAAKELLGKIIDAVGELIKKLPGKMGEVITAIVGGLTKGISKIKEIGSDIIKGLWEGINDMASWIGKKIKGFGESVLGGIKDFFGIESPSRLMREEVGSMIGRGIGVGILDSMPYVKKQLDAFSGFVESNMGNIKAGLSLDTGGAGVVGGVMPGTRSTVINAGMTVNYNGKLSRKEIKRLENDNYTSVYMRLKKEGAI